MWPVLCRPESNITDILAVSIGMELLKIVPGRVSPELLITLLCSVACSP